MTHDDDFIAQLEDYLEAFDGSTPLSDRVRDAIRAELPSARQVRPRRGLLRIFTMFSNVSAGARLGVAAATIVVAVVLGAALLNNDRPTGVVGGIAPPSGTATTVPSVAPVASASPTASALAQPLTLKSAPFAPCDPSDRSSTTCLAAGTYQLNNWPGPRTWPVRVTVDVPAGWFDWDAGPGMDAVLVDGGPTARGGSGWGVLFATVADVSRDPCDPTKGVIPAAQIDTPQKLASAMAAWPKFTATAPHAITVDNHPGVKFQLTSTASSACKDSGMLWRTTTGGAVDVYPMIASGTAERAPGTFEIVDTGSGLIVIRTTDFPQTTSTELDAGVPIDPTRHAANQPTLRAILDSIRFTALPSS